MIEVAYVFIFLLFIIFSWQMFNFSRQQKDLDDQIAALKSKKQEYKEKLAKLKDTNEEKSKNQTLEDKDNIADSTDYINDPKYRQ